MTKEQSRKRFADQASFDVFNNKKTKAARKALPTALWKIARRKLVAVLAAEALKDLSVPPNNKLHPLKKDREGQWAIWINDQYRICFRWEESQAVGIEVTDYH